jgi:glycosyltransferase involved in cell wall biosynthesis
VELVENGVDLTVWRIAEPMEKHSEIRFVFVGRLVEWKAVDVVLEAISRLKGELPLSLDITGDGNMRQRVGTSRKAARYQFHRSFLGFFVATGVRRAPTGCRRFCSAEFV